MRPRVNGVPLKRTAFASDFSVITACCAPWVPPDPPRSRTGQVMLIWGTFAAEIESFGMQIARQAYNQDNQEHLTFRVNLCIRPTAFEGSAKSDRGMMSDKTSSRGHRIEEIKRLLAHTPVIRGACELDLLVFLHRHPRALLTSERLAAFLGYDMKKIANAIEAFIDGGLLERTQNPAHAARLYVLVLDGPQGGEHTALLKLASTRQGRHDILELLDHGQSETSLDTVQEKRRLHAIA